VLHCVTRSAQDEPGDVVRYVVPDHPLSETLLAVPVLARFAEGRDALVQDLCESLSVVVHLEVPGGVATRALEACGLEFWEGPCAIDLRPAEGTEGRGAASPLGVGGAGEGSDRTTFPRCLHGL
jgi:hypothetical protein